MSKKDTEILNGLGPEEVATAPVSVASSPEAPPEKEERNTSGIYCYIGPSIRGLIKHGTTYRGTRAQALAAAKAAIEAQPLVKTLIVSGDSLPAARLKIKKPGNALYQNYQRIAGHH